jgi:hypothetical protein
MDNMNANEAPNAVMTIVFPAKWIALHLAMRG